MVDAFRHTRERFGGPDIMVNNAGIGGETDDKWERVVDVNLVKADTHVLLILVSLYASIILAGTCRR